MKLLIAEDETVLVKVLKNKFEAENFKVEITQEGDEVLPLAKKFKPDAVLLDIMMPKVNGLEVLALLKKDEDLQNVPVIMLSNLSEDEKIKKALSMGAVDYMVKTQHPVNEVIEKVNEYILKSR